MNYNDPSNYNRAVNYNGIGVIPPGAGVSGGGPDMSNAHVQRVPFYDLPLDYTGDDDIIMLMVNS